MDKAPLLDNERVLELARLAAPVLVSVNVPEEAIDVVPPCNVSCPNQSATVTATTTTTTGARCKNRQHEPSHECLWCQ